MIMINNINISINSIVCLHPRIPLRNPFRIRLGPDLLAEPRLEEAPRQDQLATCSVCTRQTEHSARDTTTTNLVCTVRGIQQLRTCAHCSLSVRSEHRLRQTNAMLSSAGIPRGAEEHERLILELSCVCV